MTKRFGFTLAEVLITLTIIGVIAAMTIPTLLSNTSDQEYKTGLKKAISTINQAITMQVALDGTNMLDFADATGKSGENLFKDGGVFKEVFQQRMQVVSTTAQRTATRNNAAIYLSDGMVIEIPNTKLDDTNRSTKCKEKKYSEATNPNGCLYTIIVDVNGDKGKCVYATQTTYSNGKVYPKDCFPLDVYPDGVRPANFVGEQIMYNGK